MWSFKLSQYGVALCPFPCPCCRSHHFPFLFTSFSSVIQPHLLESSAVEDIHGPSQLSHIVLLTNLMKYWHLNSVFKRCEMYRQTLPGHDKFPVGLPHWNFESPSKKVTMVLCCITIKSSLLFLHTATTILLMLLSSLTFQKVRFI